MAAVWLRLFENVDPAQATVDNEHTVTDISLVHHYTEFKQKSTTLKSRFHNKKSGNLHDSPFANSQKVILSMSAVTKSWGYSLKKGTRYLRWQIKWSLSSISLLFGSFLIISSMLIMPSFCIRNDLLKNASSCNGSSSPTYSSSAFSEFYDSD